MALSQRLELKQGQSLVMTPQLQQAIKLLQLSNLELGEYVEGELERNPLLERDEAEPAAPDGAPKSAEALGDAPLSETLAREDFGTAADLDAGSDDLYTDESRTEKLASATARPPRRSPIGRAPDKADDRTATTASRKTSRPKPHSRRISKSQLAIAALSADRRFIALVLIESVDEAGYLRADLTEIADRLGCPIADCEATLKVLHGFDPVGVFARDLTECLALQLKDRDRLDPAMQKLLGAARSRRQARSFRVVGGMRRRYLRHRRHDRRDPQAQSETRARLRIGTGAAGRARRLCPRRQ